MPLANPNPELLASAPHWLQTLLLVIPLIVTCASVVATFVNAYDRAQRAQGVVQSPVFLAFAAALNVFAFNGDKSKEMVKAINNPPVPVPVPETPPEVKP